MDVCDISCDGPELDVIAKEIAAAADLCNLWNLEHLIVDLGAVGRLLKNNSQTGNVKVPHGHFENKNMKQTVVPNRNMMWFTGNMEVTTIILHSGWFDKATGS